MDFIIFTTHFPRIPSPPRMKFSFSLVPIRGGEGEGEGEGDYSHPSSSLRRCS